MYSIAAPHAKGKSAEDNIFAANNRAIALAKEIGVENVTNATVGRNNKLCTLSSSQSRPAGIPSSG